MTDPADAAANSLGLDLDALKIKDDPESSGSPAASKDDKSQAGSEPSEKTEDPKPGDMYDEWDAPPGWGDEEETKSPTSKPKKKEKGEPSQQREKKNPYINPERVKTGGTQRDKLSEEELAERMTRIREQNEKIKQRRMDVQADEDAFKKTQEVDRVKAAKTKKVQENIDRTREQNARRKLDKIQNREWDAGKPTRSDWKSSKKTEEGDEAANGSRPSVGIRGAVRGGGGGRGRGRAPSSPTVEKSETAVEEPTTTPAAAAEAPAAAA
ncbi:hypothetical protein EVJ58_g1242 [Rhodofomes roseus]|uniref:Uncharacterized protein n=1 Tax=Rhodofomes roseus TaxID=34475 RepID=A0A4Y9Z0B9_9APHY|nr:hypothetical protein EVJ58_g1242 [Rhodofomes roseus]